MLGGCIRFCGSRGTNERTPVAVNGFSHDGPVQALSLFAPRRAGKTEFLVQDLAPHAEAQGHRVIYELSAAVPGTGTGAEAEIDLTRLKGEPPTNLLLHLDDLLGRVSRKTRPTILLLDEVQELARSRSNSPLVAALRTGLDKRREGLKAVFAGSSRAGLAAMFSNREAPFFHFATPIDLPALGKLFVDHVVAVFRKTSKRNLDPDGMLDAFDRLHRNPYFFRLLVQTMLYDAEYTISSALDHVRERIAADLGYPETWLALTPIQRETARALAMGAPRPFSRVFREALGAALGDEAPSAARVQAALRRLERLGIVDTARGKWELADPGFGQWLTAGDEGSKQG